MEFKDRLRQLRHEKKMTQSKLAEKLDYGYTAIANYESGKNQPSISVLIHIAKIFDVSLDYLLGVSEIRYPYPSNAFDAYSMDAKRYYAQLTDDSRQDLLLYMQWLINRQGAAEVTRSSALIAAQKSTPYKTNE